MHNLLPYHVYRLQFCVYRGLCQHCINIMNHPTEMEKLQKKIKISSLEFSKKKKKRHQKPIVWCGNRKKNEKF